MIQRSRSVSRRAIIGLGLGVWIVLVIVATLHARADGPQWGVTVGTSPAGSPVVAGIDPQGLGWGFGLRPQDELTAVDAEDAAAFVGQDIPSTAVELTFKDATGALRSVR